MYLGTVHPISKKFHESSDSALSSMEHYNETGTTCDRYCLELDSQQPRFFKFTPDKVITCS